MHVHHSTQLKPSTKLINAANYALTATELVYAVYAPAKLILINVKTTITHLVRKRISWQV